MWAFVSCKIDKLTPISYVEKINVNKKELTNKEDYWNLQDIEKDTIPGISLNRAYSELIKKKKGKGVIVAVLDMAMDINHEELEEYIYENINDPINAVDDDHNGYVDDLNGWNFLESKEGESIINQRYEYTRIIKELEKTFTPPSIDTLSDGYRLYRRAKERFDIELKVTNNVLQNAPARLAIFKNELISLGISDENQIEIEELDSLIDNNIVNKKEIENLYMAKLLNFSIKDLEDNFLFYKKSNEIYLNKNYDDRSLLADNPYDINDSIYGNYDVSKNMQILPHGTLVAGVVKKIIENTSNKKLIKIMPIVISAYGDEYDKDIYTAIHYAVNNGAKVLNISTGKRFSLHDYWLHKAILYAEKNDVLIVVSAGNESLNMDEIQNIQYPNDMKDQVEMANNFIRVGASSFFLNNKLMASFSNYGKEEVDVFAPGEYIYTTSATSDSGFELTEGTSFSAPIVSGVAALIRSYYPSLSASEVKQILMDSSVKYDILVDVPTKENPEQQLPFNELSKSGGIVNAYNAMLMAEGFVKTKKKK